MKKQFEIEVPDKVEDGKWMQERINEALVRYYSHLYRSRVEDIEVRDITKTCRGSGENV